MVDDKLIGPYILQGPLTGPVYVDFLRNDLPDLLDEWLTREEQRNLIYQHDGASPHKAAVTRNFLDENYTDRWIGQGGPIEWPARSPDLNPCDYGLWGMWKDELYHRGGDFNGDEEECINRIFDIAERIDPVKIYNATHAIVKRVMCCADCRGGNFESRLK